MYFLFPSFLQAQLEKLQAKIAAAAKKTGISSATKLALIAPSKDVQEDTIPEVEWWDAAIMPNITYATYLGTRDEEKSSKLQGITNYIEHPVQLHPPGTIHLVDRELRLSKRICVHRIKGRFMFITTATCVGGWIGEGWLD